MLNWQPLAPKGSPHEVLRAVDGDREWWLYPLPSGQGRRWRLLEFRNDSYLGASEHPSRQAALDVAECLQAVDRTP